MQLRSLVLTQIAESRHLGLILLCKLLLKLIYETHFHAFNCLQVICQIFDAVELCCSFDLSGGGHGQVLCKNR